MESNPLVAVIIGLVTASSIYVWKSDEFNKTQKTFLLFCLVFPPLQWIMILVAKYYNNLAYKKSKEYTHYTKEKKIDNSKSTLKELKDVGIITEEEYKEKVDKIDNQKTELTVINSKEYSQLKSLLDSNILTKEEFERKVNLLKSKNNKKLPHKNYRIIDGYSEGLALAIDENLEYGFVDNNGEVIIDFIFEHAENFINGTAKIRINGEFKEIDLKGNII
jgi:uncharacterized membrane protein